MNRRQFVRRATVIAAAAGVVPLTMRSAETSRGVNWPIGCFNRPWLGPNRSGAFDTALDGIKAAGYRLTGLLSRTAADPFVGSEATPEYLAELKRKIAARGLAVNMASLRTRNELPSAEQLRDLRQQIENGRTIGVEFLLTFGVDKPEHYENYYKLMREGAAMAQDRGLKLVMKPHGGASGAAEEIQRCLEQVNHPNFNIWFDAGNIIYYTGKDPVEELRPIARHVTGFCAKDCDRQRGQVMIQFGAGKVDFRAVFAALKGAGFNGPVMVEGCAPGATADEVTVNARANREFLEKLFASL